MSCRARVAERALVSSRGSDEPAGDELGVCRVRDRDGQPKLGGHALEVLVERAQRRDPAVDGLGGLGLGEHLIAERQDVGDRDREEPGRFVGPAEPEEADEVHHVLAVGPLRVLARPPSDPALEDVGDGEVEASDLGFDRRGVPTDQDRRQLRPASRSPAPARSFLLVHDPVLWRPDLRDRVALPCSFGPS